MATSRLRTATNEHADDYERSRALSGTKPATLIMAMAVLKEAVSIRQRALDEVG
ncbi:MULTISPECIES: hypothetical protein [Streptomyces]|uniref:hypothetical protein n=1 Tax=Streptomyces TaxID=1883 RepID=UPI000A8671BF|nr:MULTISPECIES: hypothetical protein [Streptomyces]MYU56289.1 hypothetical protein [Streptomyces sp. SID7805]